MVWINKIFLLLRKGFINDIQISYEIKTPSCSFILCKAHLSPNHPCYKEILIKIDYAQRIFESDVSLDVLGRNSLSDIIFNPTNEDLSGISFAFVPFWRIKTYLTHLQLMSLICRFYILRKMISSPECMVSISMYRIRMCKVNLHSLFAQS